MNAVLLDLDGVIYQGEAALPGAVATLDWLKSENIPHLFLTNTTSRPAAAICTRLAEIGVSVAAEQLLTPLNVARNWLLAQGAKCAASLVVDKTLEDLAGLAITHYPDSKPVDATIVGDLADSWTYDRLNWAFRLLLENPRAQLLALGMTRYCRSGDQLRLDVAPFVSALQCATDRQPRVMGKPGALMFESALAQLEFPASATIMVGDDIKSDIGGAQDAGLKGVLVKTGKFRAEDLAGEIRPSAIIEGIADFPGWYAKSRD